jgi:UDP-N-acetylmuramoyl-L-alanyl-D-glutamate--2,6-diaminopimelate ligase
MKISELIKVIDTEKIPRLEDFVVRGISCNSKSVKDNFVFVAIRGTREDGSKFIDEAIERGAKAVIVQSSKFKVQSSKKIPFIKVKDTRKVLAKLAAEFYGRPSSDIKVVGVTGTNGKTSITYLIESLLKDAGFQPAVIGTVNYRFKGKIIPSKNTTPGPVELQLMLSDMQKEGAEYAIAEVSSHALDQHRTEAVNFHSAIFTNLTQDHLDYHTTLENYFQAKSRLFRNLDPKSFAIVNNDDKYGRKIKKLTRAKVITYGIEHESCVMAKKINLGCCGSEFLLSVPGGKTNFKTKLIGKHNVYNILAAVAWGLEEGLDILPIKSVVQKFNLIPGRLERIDLGQDFYVFVDYAHTEDALKNIISAFRHMPSRKIFVVFGCGGERDKTKRPKMGRAVTELADFAIITSDNPRCEDPMEIIKDIKRGIKKNNYCVIPERAEAIRRSLNLAGTGDIVLVAGKGHEDYQVFKDRTIHFDDREAIRECLESMNY